MTQLLSHSPAGDMGWELEGLCSTFSGKLCSACTHPRFSPSGCFPCPIQHPSSSLGEVGMEHKTHPLDTCGVKQFRDAELGAACAALAICSPSWWVVKLLSQLFPVKSPHQEAPYLASLKKKYFSAGNCFLKTAWPPGRSCRGTDVCARRAAEDTETGAGEVTETRRHEWIRGEVLR